MNDVHAEIFIFKILEPPTKKTPHHDPVKNLTIQSCYDLRVVGRQPPSRNDGHI